MARTQRKITYSRPTGYGLSSAMKQVAKVAAQVAAKAAGHAARGRGAESRAAKIVVPDGPNASSVIRRTPSKPYKLAKAKQNMGRIDRYHNGGKIKVKGGWKNSMDKYLKYGAVQNYEYGGTTKSVECAYIGHATTPLQQMRLLLIKGILKYLLNRASILVRSWNSEIMSPRYVTVKWKPNPNDNSPESSLDISPLGLSYHAYATDIAAKVFGLGLGNLALTEDSVLTKFELKELVGSSVTTIAELNCDLAIVNFACKSEFNVQNRTPNDNANISTEVVDHVPIQGKTYEGYGNGTRVLGPNGVSNTTSALVAGPYGVIDDVALTNEYSTPLSGIHFRGVKKSGKIVIGAGSVRKSMLTYKKTMTLQQLLREIIGDAASYANNIQVTFLGKYRMFSLEKMIEVKAQATPDTGVILGWQHDLSIGLMVSQKRVVTPAYFSNLFKA